MHGLGNDFVVIDGAAAPVRLDAAAARRIADRRFGIGCDQLLLIEPPGSQDATARLRIFNTDGSEAEQCGNGVRCVAEYLRARGRAPAGRVLLETGAGRTEIVATDEGWRVGMGVPEFDPARIPLAAPARAPRYRVELPGGAVEVHALALGNPHAVLPVPDVDAAAVGELGPAIQQSPLFPRGVNVGFMQVLNPAAISLRVCERGVGETLACGSGACAAVVAGRLHHGLAATVTVGLKGGSLRIDWAGEGEPVWMTGPATTVFEGRIEA